MYCLNSISSIHCHPIKDLKVPEITAWHCGDFWNKRTISRKKGTMLQLLLLYIIIIAIGLTPTEHAIMSEPHPCPTWHYYSNNECVCGDWLKGAVVCNANSSTVPVYLAKHFCIFFSDKLNTTIIGCCPYSPDGGEVPMNTTELNNSGGLCSFSSKRSALWSMCRELHSTSLFLLLRVCKVWGIQV